MTAGFLLGLVLAQIAPADVPAQPDLQRIRKALEEPAPAALLIPSTRRDGPIFRMRIEAFELEPAWKDRSVVPPYVRTWFRPYHHEFLEQTDALSPTAEVFRSATLYPAGIPVDLVVGYPVNEIKAASRRLHEKRARNAVRAELEIFLACRANPSRRGCSKH